MAFIANSTNDDVILNLESDVPERKNLQSSLREEKVSASNNFDNNHPNIIQNVNGAVLLHYLSPEIKNNEFTKRRHKYILIVLVTIFLFFQFITVYNLSINLFNYAINKDANIEIIKLLIGFVSAYITSVVVELIAILKYVVKRVFDTSIKELIELFKEEEKKEQEN